jgi:predicted transcriptional regulator YheO
MSVRGNLNLLSLVGEAIAQSFGPSCEVVVHDLRKPDHSIVAIFNGHVTGRSVGDGVPDKDLYELAGRYQDKDALIGWRAHTPDGRPLRSTTVLIRDQAGHLYASLGINLDLSLVEAVHARASFLLEGDGYQRQVPIGKRRVSHLFRDLMDEAIRQTHKPVSRYDREDRIRIAAYLEERGAFVIRGSVATAARRLGVSRMAMYSYIDEARQQMKALAESDGSASQRQQQADAGLTLAAELRPSTTEGVRH